MLPSVSSEQNQFLTFTVGKETLAIELRAIKEILEYRSITAVPMVPDAIRGVMNLRGSVVPVIDLAARFGRTPAEVTKRTCIIIVEMPNGDERHQLGVIVDTVSQVLDIPASEIEGPPAFGAKIRTDFIQGLGKVDGKFVILLDVNHVLSMDEMHDLAKAALAATQAADDTAAA